ncbi:MAG: hypothetical protein HYT37_04285 [Candidatus Sungbacteria bacterium]|nr:hypothetical protein [Candidatus Sungbacteria bacterium]
MTNRIADMCRRLMLDLRRPDKEIVPIGYSGSLLSHEQAVADIPFLLFTDALYRELQFYLQESDGEFQLMGLVHYDEEDNRFVVEELLHPPHIAGVANADLDQDLFPLWLDQLEKEGKDIRLLRLQAHSHGLIDAYFSSVDIRTIREAYACDWMISMVGNKKGFVLARLDVFRPVALSISLSIVVESPQFVFSPKEQSCWRNKRESRMKGLPRAEAEKGEVNGKFSAPA